MEREDDVKPNLSKTFLLPLLLNNEIINSKALVQIKNLYVFDKDNIHEGSIYLLCEYSSDTEYGKFENQMIRHVDFQNIYNLNNNHVLYVFKLSKFKNEYNSFIKGKYSEYSEGAKEIILNFFKRISFHKNYVLNISGILYREEFLKQLIEMDLNVKLDEDQELGEILNIENETINIKEQIIEYEH